MSIRLTDEQQMAVDHVRGGLLVDAPAGTGKTTVLAHRVLRAVEEGVRADRILCVSFSNRACREMRERLALMAPEVGRVLARTFHGLCTTILRWEARRLGLSPDFVIFDETEREDAIRRSAGELHADPRIEADLLAFTVKLISSLKSEFIPPYIRDDIAERFAEFREREAEVARHLPMRYDPHDILDRYTRCLHRDQAVDFDDLISQVRYLFKHHGDVCDEWRDRFEWVQVDEYQDTSPEDYSVIADLACGHGNLALFGDVDQTIYEWRRSDPKLVRADFLREFDPVLELRLSRNHRSGRNVIRACEAVIRECPGSVTRELRPTSDEDGPPVRVHAADDEKSEMAWVAGEVSERVRQSPNESSRIGLLVRSNNQAQTLSDALTKQGVEHLSAEKLRFFRRPEVKDAAACLRATVNPFDNSSLIRVFRIPGLGIPAEAVKRLRGELPTVGMQVSDLVNPDAETFGDPFAPLLGNLDKGRVVIFDVETTGLDPETDHVIELAAVRVGGDCEVIGRFEELLNWGVDPGSFSQQHGLTRELIESEGHPPAEALGRFPGFADGCDLVGHNLGFDLGMMTRDAARLGVPFRRPDRWFDTLDLARRFSKRLMSYSLGEVANHLRVTVEPTHRAAADVETTRQVLKEYVGLLGFYGEDRRGLIARLDPAFHRLGRLLAKWRSMARQYRPDQLLASVIVDCGLCGPRTPGEDAYRRNRSLSELLDLFRNYDRPEAPSTQVLTDLLEMMSLGADVDRGFGAASRVFVGTVHQAKGLEFDEVYIAGANDSAFPNKRSLQEGRLEEEHRLFYVAMTRARRRLTISYSADVGDPSRYLAYLPAE